MQALIFNAAGDPANVLDCGEAAAPDGAADCVLVRATARPIQPADLAFIRGQYRIKPLFPQVAGLEGAGVIIDAPSNSQFRAGQRVAFRFPGAWAETVRVPLDRLIPVPADIADEIACQISLNGLTAIGLLEEAALRAGDWLMLTAGASTVSTLVAALAQARGINVIGLVRGPAAESKARCGTDHVLSTQDPGMAEQIAALTAGGGVSALLDSVGGPILPRLFTTLSAGARIVAYGVQDREPAAITNAMLIYSNLSWKGFGIDRWLSQTPAERRALFVDELWTMIRTGRLPLPVAGTYPLREFRNALLADAQPVRAGKILLVS